SHSKLESWIRSYGCGSSSYVLLEGSKDYFTSSHVDGFLAYQIGAGTVVVAGDPVCPPAHAALLVAEFVREMNGRPICAYQISPEMLNALRSAGFSDIQVGKEAVFDLRRFTLAGGQMELVRAATNKARREGLAVMEHNPFGVDAAEVNRELREISEQWLQTKGDKELGFLLGSLTLDQRCAKRYFIAR